MIGLIQRVTAAGVAVEGRQLAAIGRGLLVLVGVESGDRPREADRLAERLLAYRVFPDDGGKMNLNIRQINGEALLVPQFTLAADTRRGNRPGFSGAAAPEAARPLFDRLATTMGSTLGPVQRGVFGAEMQISLVNDGPVTFWLRVAPPDVSGSHLRTATD